MVGLSFAGNERSRVSYFTHVDDLFDNLKQITKASKIKIIVTL